MHFRFVALGLITALSSTTPECESSMSYEEVVMADAPLVYYRFEDGSSGGVAVDQSGYQNDGSILYTQPMDSSGTQALGASMMFYEEELSTVIVPALGKLNEVSVEVWFTSSGTDQAAAIYTVDGWEAGALHLHLAGEAKSVELAVLQEKGEGELVGGGPLELFTWHHLVTTFDAVSGEATLYVDGVSVATANFGEDGSGVDLAEGHIGTWNGGSRGFYGQMDEFAIYGRALSSDEVLKHYNAAMDSAARTQRD